MTGLPKSMHLSVAWHDADRYDCGTLGISPFQLRWDGGYRGAGGSSTILAVIQFKNTE